MRRCTGRSSGRCRNAAASRPRRNETLFLLGCAERLLDAPSPALEARLCSALRAAAAASELPGAAQGRQLHVRIVVTQREGEGLREHEAWRRTVPAQDVA